MALWPEPNLPHDDLITTDRELTDLVRKQLDLWQAHPNIFGRPPQFQTGGAKSTVDAVILQGVQELFAHDVQNPSPAILRARRAFDDQARTIRERIEEASFKPEPRSALERATAIVDGGIVACFWKCVFIELPLLSFLALGVLGKCAASEAAAERLFFQRRDNPRLVAQQIESSGGGANGESSP